MNGGQQGCFQSPVSVIVPCYNSASVITRAIESVVKQTYPPKELIVVNDASGDATLQVLEALACEYKILRIVSLDDNQGAASSRNAGWQYATQPFVAFLDADDAWHPRKLEIQFLWMSANPDVFLSGHQHTLSDWHELNPIGTDIEYSEIHPYRFLFGNCFATPTVMLKNDPRFRFRPGQRWAEDLGLWQLIAFEKKIVKLQLPLTQLCKSEYGISGLSAQMWRMEKSELSNLLFLYRENRIGFFLMSIAVLFSVIKFFKRLFVVKLRNAINITKA